MDLHTKVTTGPAGTAILVIGPLDSRRCALRNILTPAQWEIREAATYGEAIAILDNRDIEVAICDTEIEDGNWQVLLANLQSRADPPHLIVSSRLADERLWAEVLNLGGYDVLAQPFDRSEVLRVVRMAWMAGRQERRCSASETHGHLRAGAAAS
jgi:DNA-binding NtrC family response regulator